MRDNCKHVILLLLLSASCSRDTYIPIRINPIQININADIELLQEQLKKRNTVLAYENSYEGEMNGIKKFYFDDENDSLHYHVVIYTLSDEINGIEAEIYANDYAKEKLYRKVESNILFDFKNSAKQMTNDLIKVSKDTSWDGKGIYYFKVITKTLKDRI